MVMDAEVERSLNKSEKCCLKEWDKKTRMREKKIKNVQVSIETIIFSMSHQVFFELDKL